MAINKISGVDEKVFEKCGFSIPYKGFWICKYELNGFNGWSVCGYPDGTYLLFASGYICEVARTIRGAKAQITKYLNSLK